MQKNRIKKNRFITNLNLPRMDKLNNIANNEYLRFTQTGPLGELHHAKVKERVRRLLGRLCEYEPILIFRYHSLLHRMHN
jgi:hypothetical protein